MDANRNPKQVFKALFHRGNAYRDVKEYEKSVEDLTNAAEIDAS